MKSDIVVIGALDRSALLLEKLHPNFTIIFINLRKTFESNPVSLCTVLQYSGNFSETLNSISSLSKNIKYVIASSEDGVELSDQLNEAFELRWNDSVLKDARRDKFKMQSALKNHGANYIHSFTVREEERLFEKIDFDYNYPIVLKPIKSAASDSVFVCQDQSDVLAKFKAIIGHKDIFGNINTDVLVQEFIRGIEYVVDTMSFDGEAVVCAVWRYNKVISSEGNVLYRSMELLDPNCDVSNLLIPYAMDVLKAVGIKFGPSHQEIMITNDGTKPVLIEIGARLHGGAGGYLGAQATEHSITDMFVDVLTNQAIFSEYLMNGCKYRVNNKSVKEVFVISSNSGLVSESNFLTILQRYKSFFQLKKDVVVGSKVERTIDLKTSPTSILLVGDESILIEDEKSIYECERSGGFYKLN